MRSVPPAAAEASRASPAPVAPRVDWDAAARRAAASAMPPPAPCASIVFDEHAAPHCAGPRSTFHFTPPPPRAGFAGGLPYVRLGRCVLGLGFFGCAVGPPREADGHLFDELKRDAPAAAAR